MDQRSDYLHAVSSLHHIDEGIHVLVVEGLGQIALSQKVSEFPPLHLFAAHVYKQAQDLIFFDLDNVQSRTDAVHPKATAIQLVAYGGGIPCRAALLYPILQHYSHEDVMSLRGDQLEADQADRLMDRH